jgi:phenylalanyl-tRNA synthetase beta subunit
VEVFDVYTSKQEEGSKTSYSVSIILQDFQNTLQEARITKVIEKITKLVEEQTGAVLRD